MARDVMDQVRRNEMTLTRQRALAHSATLVTLDKQGRVTIDDKLRTLRPPRAELEGDRRRATSTGPRCGARSSTTASPRPVAASWRAARNDVSAPPTTERRSEDRRRTRDQEAPAAPVSDPFEHRPVMLDEIVDVFTTVPPGVLLDATLGGGGHTEAILDRRPDLVGHRHRPRSARPRRGDGPARALRRPLPPRPRPVRRPPPDHGHRPDPPPGHRRRPERRPVRPRRLLAAARPRRPRLLVPPGRAARHAHGPGRPVVGVRRRQRLRRRRADPRHPRATATSASPPASPGPSSPPARSSRPSSWPAS